MTINCTLHCITFEKSSNLHCVMSLVGHVQHCGPHSAVLPWAVAGVSLSINVAFTIYVIWYDATAAFYVLKALTVRQQIMAN